MNGGQALATDAGHDEIPALIDTLLATERRLVELTAGEVDAVADSEGRTFLLRRAQEQLRMSEASKQAAILNALPARIALLDAQGGIISVNEAWRRFAGSNALPAPGHGVGLNYLEICDAVQGERQPRARQAATGIRSVLAGEENEFSVEYPSHSPAEERWFLMMVTPLAGEQGHGAVVMHLDITERKRSHAALQEREAALNEAQRLAGLGSWHLDVESEQVRWSPETFRIFGRDPGQGPPLYSQFAQFLTPESLAIMLAAVRNTIEQGVAFEIELEAIRPDQSRRWMLARGELVRGATDGMNALRGTALDITERKRADQALRESNEKFLQLADNITDAFWIRSPDFSEVQYVSPAFEKIWGRSTASLYASPERWTEFIFPEDRGRVLAAFAALTTAVPHLDIEYRIVRPDEEIRWIHCRGFQVRNAADQLIRHIGIVTDITERRQTTEALRTSEEEFRTLAEAMPQIVWVARADGEFTYISRQWMDYTGLTLEESLGFEWKTALHPDQRAAAAAAWQHATVTTGIYSLELRIRRADGEYRWWLTRGVPVCDGGGNIVKWFGTCTDIHDLKVAELEIIRTNRALQMAEAKYRSIFENSTEGIFQTTREGRFLSANPAMAGILGFSSPEELIRERTDIGRQGYAQPEVRADFIRQMEEAGFVNGFEYEVRRKDGTTIWVTENTRAVRDGAGHIEYYEGSFQDITERKRLEEQLRQAQKMDAIGTLAGGIAHDFNNILAAINGYTELSQMVLTGNPEVRDHLAAVLLAAGRATDLVRQILTFSRQQPLARRPIQLLPVVAEALTLLRATIPSTIEFETSLPTNAPTVLADSSQIHQILMNLGTNAWHAMKERTGRLKVTLERCVVDETHAASQARLRPGVYARVSVSDTGSGMNAATLRRIFEPFFTTKPLGEGTGLGLAVVHGIMDTHDGAITVYSQPGEGTVFHLYFPAHASEPALFQPAEGLVPRGGGERILFVDDEDLLVALGRKALAALGYEVEIATDPAAALALVRADPRHFALVITDQTMPRMTGMTLAGELQQIRPGLPIILTTGYSQTLTPEAVQAAGLRQLLLKPFTIHSLGSAVRAALSGPPYLRNIYGSNPPY